MNEPMMRIEGLRKVFPVKQSLFEIMARRPIRVVLAVDSVNLTIEKRENLGLVGESGCGKSTLARTVIRLYEPDAGKVYFDGLDLAHITREALREERRRMQMIFQDPYSSLNPRMSVRDMLSEALLVHKICSKSQLEQRIAELLDMVGLSMQVAERFPGEFSGGQRQRIGIARALALNPTFVIADEPVSALDVSIQAQIINLLDELQKTLDLTILFISHDLGVVRHITHRVAVMYLGKIVEIAPTEALFARAHHPYAQVLLNAEPNLDPRIRSRSYAIEGEPPNPIDVPPGCRFHPRCAYAAEKCPREEPILRELSPGRQVACHYPLHVK